MENKRKHLEFIQGVISRMARNSFLLKGWTVTLVVVLFAVFLKGESEIRCYVFVASFPVVLFWILDGYFLSQEKLFRNLYEHVRKLDESEIDFSMNADECGNNKGNNFICSMLSYSLLLFYMSMVVVIFLAGYWMN